MRMMKIGLALAFALGMSAPVMAQSQTPYVPERREARLGVQAGGTLLRLGPHQLREVRLDNHEVPLVS